MPLRKDSSSLKISASLQRVSAIFGLYFFTSKGKSSSLILLRRYRGLIFVGSLTYLILFSLRNPSASDFVISINGLMILPRTGGIAERHEAPEPLISLIRNVSACSSASFLNL